MVSTQIAPACGIPEQPTESEIKDLVMTMERHLMYEQVHVNAAECERLRGTPGEPIPRYELISFFAPVFPAIYVERRNHVLRRNNYDPNRTIPGTLS